jgi:hypothetical protein
LGSTESVGFVPEAERVLRFHGDGFWTSRRNITLPQRVVP